MHNLSLLDIAFQNRLIKQFRHLGKWARRQKISCFRVYDHDLNDAPITVDWMDGDVVAWIHPRKKDDSPEKELAYRSGVRDAILSAFQIEPSRLFVKERKIQQGSDQYSKLGRRAVTRVVEEGGLKFELNLSDYLDVGLFLDHRKTRQMVRDLSEGLRVLNLFAYTGSFTCYAAAGGCADSISVEMNPNYCEWINRNFELNGILSGGRHRVVESDCLHFLSNTRNGKFDLVVCDPPTFSNSKRKDATRFGIVEDYPSLLNECLRVLDDDGILIFSTNARGFAIDPIVLSRAGMIQEISAQTQSEDFSQRDGHRCWMIRPVTDTPALGA